MRDGDGYRMGGFFGRSEVFPPARFHFPPDFGGCVVIDRDSRDAAKSRAIEAEAEHRRKLNARNRRQRELYGPKHRRRRRQFAQRLERGELILCPRCNQVIGPDQRWDLGHDDYTLRSRGRSTASATGPRRTCYLARASGSRLYWAGVPVVRFLGACNLDAVGRPSPWLRSPRGVPTPFPWASDPLQTAHTISRITRQTVRENNAVLLWGERALVHGGGWE